MKMCATLAVMLVLVTASLGYVSQANAFPDPGSTPPPTHGKSGR